MSRNEAATYYRLYSARCVEIAQHLNDPGNRASLLSMAQAWLALADQANKNGDAVLVYETPTLSQRAARDRTDSETLS